MAVEHFRGTCAHVRALTSMSVVPLVDGIDLYVLRGDGSTLVLISSCCQHSMVPRTCTPTRWWRLLSSILYVQKKLAETRLCVHRPNFFSGTGVIRLFFLFTNRCNHGFVRLMVGYVVVQSFRKVCFVRNRMRRCRSRLPCYICTSYLPSGLLQLSTVPHCRSPVHLERVEVRLRREVSWIILAHVVEKHKHRPR